MASDGTITVPWPLPLDTYLQSLRQKPGAQRHMVRGGLQCPKQNSEEEQQLAPLPHQGLAHGGMWESIHLAHALTVSQRESTAVASNINSMEKYGGEDQACA